MSGSLYKNQLSNFVKTHSDLNDKVEDGDGNFYKSPSIRRIQRNLVRDRAVRFESKDLISDREPRSDKAVTAGNMRSAKSLVNLNSAGLSNRPEKNSYLPISADSSKSSIILSKNEVTADIVSKRLSMFETLSSPHETPVKPALLPKPRYISRVGADDHLTLSRSKSTEPVSASTKFDFSVQNKASVNENLQVTELSKLTTTKQVCVKELVPPFNPKPPPKPPRAIAVQQPNTAPQASYGLMVYAVSPTEIRVEQIDHKAVPSSCVSMNSSVSELKDHSSMSTLSSSPSSQSAVRGTPNLNQVLSSSAAKNHPAFSSPGNHSPRPATHHTTAPSVALSSQSNDLWEKKFIRSPTTVLATHATGKGRFVKNKFINNPNYMMVDDRNDAVLGSRLAVDDIAVRPLMHHGSSDRLISPAQLSHFEEPAYADPDSLIFPRLPIPASTVEFDSAGYALPNQVQLQVIIGLLMLLKVSSLFMVLIR